MEIGPTRYVLNGDHHIAYAVAGDGPVDLMYAGSGFVPFSMWEDYPPLASMLDRLASFARLVLVDRRGIGASDPITAEAPGTTAQVGDDLAAILTEIDTPGAAVFCEGIAVPPAIELAAARPDLVTHLILFNGFARAQWSPDYPYGIGRDEGFEVIERLLDPDDGGTAFRQRLTPSVADDETFLKWSNRGGALGASRTSAEILYRAVTEIDVRHLLEHVRVPTLVLHRRDARFYEVDHSRFLAKQIPDAHLIELEGADQLAYVGDMDVWLEALEQFVVGASSGEGTRRLRTMLFTDIAGSTEVAADVGDRRWSELLNQHDQITSARVRSHQGRRVTITGDGALSVFETPTAAIAAAAEIIETLQTLGLAVRAAIHTGEVEQRGDNIGGLAVNLTARILDLAEPGEILVSGALPAITIGSAITYEQRGVHELRGVPGRWPVLAARLA